MPVAEHTSSHEYTAAASAGRWSSRATSESPRCPDAFVRAAEGNGSSSCHQVPVMSKSRASSIHATTHPQRKRPSINRSTAPVVQILELALKVFCTASARA
jgi:hypothetical protein